MDNFAAIDFETANNKRCSVCSVGIVIVRDGKVADDFYSLIRPTPNYYLPYTTSIHGLTRADTDDAPRFPEVWGEVEKLIEGLPLVAHNRPFDEGCLKAVFAQYSMKYPEYEFHCTLAAARRNLRLRSYRLNHVARACGFELEHHHHALADAEACAAIAMRLL